MAQPWITVVCSFRIMKFLGVIICYCKMDEITIFPLWSFSFAHDLFIVSTFCFFDASNFSIFHFLRFLELQFWTFEAPMWLPWLGRCGLWVAVWLCSCGFAIGGRVFQTRNSDSIVSEYSWSIESFHFGVFHLLMICLTFRLFVFWCFDLLDFHSLRILELQFWTLGAPMWLPWLLFAAS